MKRKISFIIFIIFIFLYNTNIYAEHSHTNECYINTTQHICDGDENNFGNCYSISLNHIHTISCYNKVCNGEDYSVSHTFVKKCEKCGCDITQAIVTCNKCGISSTFKDCSNPSCANITVPKFDKQMQHKELSEDLAINQGIITCGKEENEIIGYEKTCLKENGKFYDENGNIANTKCHLIAKSYKPEIEFPTIDNFSNRVIIEYLDGHTDYITGYSGFENLDKTISYDNYPITITFSILLNGSSIETEHIVTCYFTNIVENNENIESVDKKENFEIVESANNVIEETIETKNEITTTITPTPTETLKIEDEKNVDTNENNNVIVETNNEKLKTSSILIVTTITIISLIIVFIIINLFIINKKNKQ